jgi:hypothetical protein
MALKVSNKAKTLLFFVNTNINTKMNIEPLHGFEKESTLLISLKFAFLCADKRN